MVAKVGVGPVAAPTTTAGRYTLGAAFAADGRRELVRGWAHSPARPVAVERVTGLGAARLAVALAHAHELVGLEHPNLPAIIEGYTRQGALHLALAPGAGQPLARREDMVTPAEARELAIQICNGLNFLRWRGLPPPAIAPATVFVTTAGRVKLTNVAAIAGAATPRSFGRFSAGSATDRATVWGVGATIHHTLTGWAGDYHHAPPALALRPDLTPDFAALVDRALAPRPRDRFTDSVALRFALLALAF